MTETVYVLTTDIPGTYKIGRTSHKTEYRVKQLQTPCVKDIKVLLEYYTNNSVILEKKVHDSLSYFRTPSNREHFKCDIEAIKGVIFSLGEKVKSEDYSKDIVIQNDILNNQKLTDMVNDCIQGYKVNSLAKLLFEIHPNHTWSNSKWYHYNNNNWVLDKTGSRLKLNIMTKLCNGIINDKIYSFYKNKTDSLIKKTLKTLIINLNSVKFKCDIIEESKQYYEDPDFELKLDSKKNLLPFNNGVFDLLTKTFRPNVKEDYIKTTLNYDYDEHVVIEEVETFIEQILPEKGDRDFILKKLSECLNGYIPNTTFIMLIGNQGANGKSQLLNLMNLVMGGFSEKMNVSLITRKRKDADRANTEKIKLMNKRFAYFSEPEDSEKINIGLLKELTGSEPVVARGLYQESKTFIIEAKMFLSCNELPAIKGEDSALWRRIKVVNFSSTFVKEPSANVINQFKEDTSIPYKMKVDVRWRQTFMNILLKYYYLNVIESNSVKLSTTDYRQNNDEMLEFTEKFIRPVKHSIILWNELFSVYQEWYYDKNGGESKPVKKKSIKSYFENNIFKKKEYSISGKGRGWINFKLIRKNS